MSFDCKNTAPSTTCGDYIQQYIGNMEYVSQGILTIINSIILSQEGGPNDITDPSCNCLPICDGTNAPCVTESNLVFNDSAKHKNLSICAANL